MSPVFVPHRLFSSLSKECGRVIWFNPSKGFGFIERLPPAPQETIFAHHTAIRTGSLKPLQSGQIVEYRVGEGVKGTMALDITIKEQK